MGNWNSGRRRQPIAIAKLHGTFDPRSNPDAPQLETASPAFDTPPPEILGAPIAVAEWSRIVPMLRAAGVISHAERAALVALCLNWAQWIEAQERIRGDGMIIAGSKGAPIRNPYLRIANELQQQMQRLWSELGLTPASRARLTKLPIAPVSATPPKWGNDL